MKTLAWFFLICFLPACIQNRVLVNYTPLESQACSNPVEQVYLFFDGETVPFSYRRVGLLEVLGTEGMSSTEVLQKLKKQAAGKCANAVIGISTASTTRELNCLGCDNSMVYQANSFRGLAVQVEEDSAFLAKYGHQGKPTQPEAEPVRQSRIERFAGNLILAAILISLVVVLMPNDE